MSHRLRQCLFRLAAFATCWFLLPSSAHAAWWTLDLPGEPSRLAALAGLPADTPRAQWLTRLVRHANEPVGENAPDIVAIRGRLLAAIETAASTDARTSLPLPLPFETWREALRLDERATHVDLLRLLLGDRRAGLLYHGLMALDDETRAALVEEPRLLRRLSERASGAFGVFSAALHVSDGRVVPPGGASFVGVWEEVLGERVTDPAAFIEALYRRDGGRVAYVYDTVAGLDAARFHLLLGTATTAEARDDAVRRVRALVSLVRARHPEWVIEARPFQRPIVDLARVVTGLAVGADGSWAGPMSERFWSGVFSGGLPDPGDAADWRRDVAKAPPLDPLAFVSAVIHAEAATAVRRWDAAQFVQRRFATGEAPIDAVAWAARGVVESPALIFTLERLGTVDAQVYAAATRRARQLLQAGGLGALAQCQAVLAAISYGHWSGALTDARAQEWAHALLAIAPSGDGYQGRVATWFDEVVSSELPGEATSGDVPGEVETEEQRILRWLTHAGGTGPQVEVVWDGERYRVDPGAGEFDRIKGVRRRQSGPTLTAALELVRALRAAATAPYAARTMLADDLRAAGAALPERLDERFGGGRPAEATARVADRIRQISANRWRTEAAEAVATLSTLADAAFTEAMVGLVYALHLGRAEGPVALAPDIAARHSWVIGEPGRDRRDVWRWPRDVLGSAAGWHVTGSLLGLDVAVGRLRLPELAIERVSSQPRVNANDRRTLALGVAWLSPTAPTDAVRDAVAGAIDRGRERLAALPRLRPEARAALGRQAGWSAWRLNEMAWTIEHDPRAIDALHTIADAFWVGVAGQLPPAIPAKGWAGPRTAADGRMELEVQPPVAWETQVGRPGSGTLTSTFIDPALRALEWLSDRGYPARLAGPLIGALVVEVVYAAPLTHAEDVLSMATVVKRSSTDELDDMMGQLVINGYLRLADIEEPDEDAEVDGVVP